MRGDFFHDRTTKFCKRERIFIKYKYSKNLCFPCKRRHPVGFERFLDMLTCTISYNPHKPVRAFLKI